MKIKLQSRLVSPSKSSRSLSQCFTPRKLSNSTKGINLTIKKKNQNIPNTNDRTLTSTLSYKKLNTNYQPKYIISNKTLFTKDSPYVFSSPDKRNNSLPSFNFNHSFSGFSVISKPYNKINEYSISPHTRKSSN